MRWLAGVLAFGLGVAHAGGEAAAPAPGQVLFVKQGSLMRVVPDGKSAAQEMGPLPGEIGTATWLSTSRDGKLVVVQGDKGAAWRLGDGAWNTQCTGRATPAPAGGAVLCDKAGVLSLFSAVDGKITPLGTGNDGNFWGGPEALVILGGDGVLGFQVATPRKKKKLAKAGPQSNLLVAPNGTQAVAVFPEGKSSRIEVFMLDGDGTPRRLGGPGVPLAWSWDSDWVLIEEGDAPATPEGGGGGGGGEDGGGDDGGGDDGGEGFLLQAPRPWIGAGFAWAVTKKATPPARKKTDKKKKGAARREAAAAAKFGDGGPIKVRACVARAAGGETKCWNGYSPRGVSPEGQRILLYKDGSLAIGKLAGVRPEPPKKLVDGASGPATWIP